MNNDNDQQKDMPKGGDTYILAITTISQKNQLFRKGMFIIINTGAKIQ